MLFNPRSVAVLLFCSSFVWGFFPLQSVGLPNVLKSNYYILSILNWEVPPSYLSLTFLQLAEHLVALGPPDHL